MQVIRNRRPTKRPRGGFTLIELLVVISIIAVLMALLLPGIQNARAAARRIQCENNMRNVSTALHSYQTANNGRLPWLITDPTAPAGLFSLGPDPLTGNTVPLPVPWAVQLLPYLEQQSLFDRFTAPNPPAAGPDSIAALRQTPLSIFTCPDDPNAESGGTLTQVVNAGLTTQEYWVSALSDFTYLNAVHVVGTPPSPALPYDYSYNQLGTIDSNDRDVTQANGLFWQQAFNDGYRSRIDTMKDGQSNTVVITENQQARFWWSPFISDVAYVVPMAGTANQFASNESIINGLGPLDGQVYSTKSNALRYATDGSAAVYMGINFAADPALQQARINANIGASEGFAPRPGSLHPGVVNVFFGDGHGQSVSQNINDLVWFNLTTPAGQRHGENIQGGEF